MPSVAGGGYPMLPDTMPYYRLNGRTPARERLLYGARRDGFPVAQR